MPRRDRRFDWQEPVDGSNPATDWKGYHTIDDLPQLSDPKSGWMQNNNTTPFLLTDQGNPDPSEYPPYMVTEGDNMRGARVRHLLAGHPKFTWDEWVHAAFDTRVQLADSLLPEMIATARRAGAGSAERREALAVLEQWNHHTDTASVAMTLLAGWGQQLEKFPQARQGEPAVQAAALDSALASLTRDWGTWQVPWGQVSRLQRFDDTDPRAGFRDTAPSIAVSGVPDWLGAVFTVYSTPVGGQRNRYAVDGGTYVSAVELGPKVRAVAVHVFGASANPARRTSSTRPHSLPGARCARPGLSWTISRRTWSGRTGRGRRGGRADRTGIGTLCHASVDRSSAVRYLTAIVRREDGRTYHQLGAAASRSP